MPLTERDDQIKSEYESGSSLRTIAKDWGYSIEGIRKILKRNGVKMRLHGINQFTKLKTILDT